jgi:hypothetical protein
MSNHQQSMPNVQAPATETAMHDRVQAEGVALAPIGGAEVVVPENRFSAPTAYPPAATTPADTTARGPPTAHRNLLTQNEVATQLRLSPSTIKRLANDPKSGFPKAIRFSDAHNAPRLYFADELAAYLEMRVRR